MGEKNKKSIGDMWRDKTSCRAGGEPKMLLPRDEATSKSSAWLSVPVSVKTTE